MKIRRIQCTSFAAQEALAKEIFLSVGQGFPLSLSENSRRHLEECPFCVTELSRLIERYQDQRLTRVWDLVNRYNAGERSMMIREFPEGTALYEPSGGGGSGIFAFIAREVGLVAYDEIYEEVFNRWSPANLTPKA